MLYNSAVTSWLLFSAVGETIPSTSKLSRRCKHVTARRWRWPTSLFDKLPWHRQFFTILCHWRFAAEGCCCSSQERSSKICS